MKNIINEIKIASLDEMYLYLTKNNLSVEDMIVELSKNNSIVNEFLCYKAVDNDDIDMAKKIIEVIEIIHSKKLLEFKEAINNGTHKEFLSKTDWRTKSILWIKINGLLEKGIPELKKYEKDILYSIKQDEENEELNEIINELKKQNKEKGSIIYGKKPKNRK